MNTSSLYTVPAGDAPFWNEDTPNFGWVYATRLDLPLPADITLDGDQDVIHCAPGTHPPENVVQILVEGHKTPWLPYMLVVGWPNGHLYVMDGTWEVEGEIRRSKVIEKPEGVDLIEMLVPHQWAGESISMEMPAELPES